MVAVLAAVLALGGCGLPSRTEPKYAGPAQSPAAAQGAFKAPPLPTDGLSTTGLVASFLQASVGANLGGEGVEPDANKESLNRMKQYLTAPLASVWKPLKGVVVVRDPVDIEPIAIGSGKETVSLQLHPLGTLNENGEVVHKDVKDIAATYQTVLVGGQRRFEAVPDQLYISESGLKEWYLQQPIYFWGDWPDSPRLVPDLRYMPSTLSRTKQVTEILRWLQNGPGQLVQGVAARLLDSFVVSDNPVIEDADVKVNLSSKATTRTKDELNRLARQIRWSLPDHQPVKLTIETQGSGASSDGYENDNAAVEASQVDLTRYCVVTNVARSLTIGTSSPENTLFLPSPGNAQVVSAAINRQGSRAALVRQTGSGSKAEQRLFVSSTEQTVGEAPKYVDAHVAAPRLSRPAWITYPVKRLMISDGARLLISTDEAAVNFEQVGLSTVLATAPITAFSVAPEGRRIAFIADRTLMVAPLLVDNNKLSIGPPVPVSTSLGDNQAVGWLTETALVVGGKPTTEPVHRVGGSVPKYSLVGVTIDGAQEEPLPPLLHTDSTSEVTMLVAHVNRPGFPMDYQVMFESNGVAQRLYSDVSQPMVPEGSAASPPTSPAQQIASAPFFAD
jgi:hypothetical protein